MSTFHKEKTSQGCSMGTLFQPHSYSMSEPLASGRPESQCGLWHTWFLLGALSRLSDRAHVTCDVTWLWEPQFTDPQGAPIVTRSRANKHLWRS